MSGAIKLTAQLGDWSHVKRMLTKPEELWGEPWKAALEEAADLVETSAKRRAPRQTGTLYGSIKTGFQRRPVPLWAKVTANSANKRFRYGWALNFSQKREYQFRSGPSAGRRTLHWFTGVLYETRGQVNRLLEGVAEKIARRWGR